ncbi:MAG: methyltransferase domain-containing protein [Deltaproteobacteria bacterium]|nr:MAG: methyltransferase domain-containing protein [Deltaproteobacteria bacterium]
MTWESAWKEGRTQWDAGQSAPALLKLLADGTLPKGTALVPGCGSGYDVFALARNGWKVLGMDIAPTAVERFHALREERGLTREQADIVNADFFTFSPEQPFHLIYDYTFLCAIEPEMREKWASQMSRLLADDGELVTLIFPVREDTGGGPPYSMSTELVFGLLEESFTNLLLDPVEKSHPGREGKEYIARWKKK